MKISICRVVGNELPPRDTENSKLNSLKWVINNEKLNVHKIWVLNHIIDKNYRQEVLNVLKNEEIIEDKFQYQEYLKYKTWDSKVCYAININKARNLGINYCFNTGSDFVISLDQDCYFDSSDYFYEILNKIKKDQYVNEDRKYYGLYSKRVCVNNIPKDISQVANDELMIIFKKNSPDLFDPNIRFGNNCKIDLLKKLGYKPDIKNHLFPITGNKCLTIGYVTHIAFSDEKIEKDLDFRISIRKESLNLFLSSIEKKYNIKLC